MAGAEISTLGDSLTTAFPGDFSTLGNNYAQPVVDHSFRKFYDYFASIVPWVSIWCNGLAFVVFAYKLKHSKREKNVNMLLMGLAVADILALSSFMDYSCHFWTDYEYSLMQTTDVGCRLIRYISIMASDCSSYFVLIFTLDRFVSVKFPLKKQLWVNSRRVGIAMVAVVVGAALAELYQPYLLAKHELVDFCYAEKGEWMNKLVLYVHWMGGFVLPGTVVAILNCFIAQLLAKFSKQRASMTGGSEKHNRSLTILLISISTYSFLVGLPKVGYLLYTELGIHDQMESQSDSYYNASYITDALSMLNHTCNFFFYCMSGSQFRKDLVAILIRVFTCGKRGHDPFRTSVATATRVTEMSRTNDASVGKVEINLIEKGVRQTNGRHTPPQTLAPIAGDEHV